MGEAHIGGRPMSEIPLDELDEIMRQSQAEHERKPSYWDREYGEGTWERLDQEVSDDELLGEAIEEAVAAGVSGERVQAMLDELDANGDDPFAVMIAAFKLRNLARSRSEFRLPGNRLG
jgi:hypothetical protein